MNCQACNENPATVHIIDIGPVPEDAAHSVLLEKHVCEECARGMKLPHMELNPKGTVQFIKLLQEQVRRAREEGSLRCPDCGMTLAEFRSKGRLGCPNDYRVFQAQLQPLLQRIHNATQHIGRVPGIEDDELKRMQTLSELKSRLEEAVREEAYESAAALRDEIQSLENLSEPGATAPSEPSGPPGGAPGL
jgi:protein arginine kinase activator